MMTLNNLRLEPRSILPKVSDKSFVVIATKILYQKNEDGTTSDVVTQLILTCACNGYSQQNFKLPTTCKSKVQEIQQHLEKDDTVKVSFTNLIIKPFVIFEKNISGITCRANDVNIVSVEESEPDEDFGEIEI